MGCFANMVRRGAIAVLLVFLLALSSAEAKAKRPNILFCISDDQSFPHASAYGTTWVKTPAFDRVAREGLLFTRAYTPNAKCAPSRAVVLTGRQTWQLRSAANHGDYYPEGLTTFVEALGRAGYVTGYTGKGWAPGVPGEVDGRPRQITGPAFNQVRTPGPTTRISPTDYAANFAEFLRQRSDRPFVFWFGGFEPHRAYEPGSGVRAGKKLSDIDRVPLYLPDNDTVRSDLLDYALEIEHFDTHLGRMLTLLEECGELDNTLVVVTSDNGMPFPRVKGTTYEASLHLPLAMRWPGGIARPGRTIEELVSFVDLAPTFLEVAGVPFEQSSMEPMAGRSLATIFAAVAEEERAREFLVFGQERHDLGRPGDVGYPVRGVVSAQFLYFMNLEAARWPMCDPVTGYLNTDGSPTKTLILEENRRGVNHWRWQLNFGRRPAEELYDLRRDPDCLNNLAGDAGLAGTLATLRDVLRTELERTDDPRLSGQGKVFDLYPVASANRDLYRRRVVDGEKFKLSWVNDTDFEDPAFDPEHPFTGPRGER